MNFNVINYYINNNFQNVCIQLSKYCSRQQFIYVSVERVFVSVYSVLCYWLECMLGLLPEIHIIFFCVVLIIEWIFRILTYEYVVCTYACLHFNWTNIKLILDWSVRPIFETCKVTKEKLRKYLWKKKWSLMITRWMGFTKCQ